MADRKITDMSALAAGEQATGDLITVVDIDQVAAADKNKKMTMEALFQGIPGNVGIGTTNPDSPLEVAGTGPSLVTIHHSDGGTNDEARLMLGALSGNQPDARGAGIAAVNNGAGHDLTIKTSSSHSVGPTEKMRIDSSGRLLVGTSTWSVGSDKFVFAGNTVNNNESVLSIARINAPSTNDNLGLIRFHGQGNNTEAARISVLRDGGTWTSGSSHPGRLVFSTTADSASSPTERMRIDSNGRVKIGNDANYSAATGSKLAVELMTTAGTILEIADQTAGFSTFESVKNAGGGATDYGGYILAGRRDADDDIKEYMRIDGAGHVAIGQTDTSPHFSISNGSVGLELDPDFGFSSRANTGTLRAYDRGSSAYKDLGLTGTEILFGTSDSERMRIDSSGNVGIGTTSPSYPLEVASSASSTVNIVGGTSDLCRLFFSDTTVARGFFNYDHADDSLRVGVAGSERARIDSSGRLLVGTTSARTNIKFGTTSTTPVVQIETATNSWNNGLSIINNSTGGYAAVLRLGTSKGSAIGSNTLYDAEIGKISFSSADGTNFLEAAKITANVDGTPGANDMPGLLVFATTADGESIPTERMRIRNDGTMWLNTGGSSPSGSVSGLEFHSSGYIYTSVNGGPAAYFNRNTNDGVLVELRQANTVEGTISVSGSTVSYNGAHLSRWSQLPGGVERTEILRGSVLSNIDEMCEWAYDAEPEVLWAEGDELPEGVSVGDVKTPARDAGTEENEQLNRMKVSDIEGDRNVSGVFQGWDNDDDTYINDFYCAMTGDFVIRIAQGVTVERGDLLMSAGDGTAKPQDDDIIRSKTIAKVTSTHVSETYADGSYCVPCVLMAC